MTFKSSPSGVQIIVFPLCVRFETAVLHSLWPLDCNGILFRYYEKVLAYHLKVLVCNVIFIIMNRCLATSTAHSFTLLQYKTIPVYSSLCHYQQVWQYFLCRDGSGEKEAKST